MTRVLGIDPGSLQAGWALLEGDVHHARVVDLGVLDLTSADDFAGRLLLLRRGMDDLLVRLCPHAAAVESPFQGRSSRSALQLAHARGVVIACLAVAAIPIAEYPPATVKKAVTGSGKAEKDQVQRMVCRLLSLQVAPATDASDAAAVALCHLASQAMAAARRLPARRASRRGPAGTAVR